jgi:glyoxylase-like metal-dependent hydrolase (beta-lactamase superfamily II)
LFKQQQCNCSQQEAPVLQGSVSTLAFSLPLSLFVLHVDARSPVSAQEMRSPRFPVSAQDAGGPQTGTLEQIIPGHYTYTSGNRVSGVIVTSEGVVVLDALSSEAMARHKRQLIATTIKQPVRFLISSTFHDNYTEGNVAYDDVIRIGHEDYKADLLDMMKKDKVPEALQAARLPHQTYRGRMSLHLGSKEIQILHLGKGHTRGDSIVFVPADRIVYMSELLFYDRFPYMNTGYIDWIETLDAALKLDADIFVPGQGPATWQSDPRASRQAMLRFRQVLVDFRDAVQKEIARGATEDDVVATVMLPQYQGLGGYKPQREVVLRRTYRNLKGTLP